MTLFLKNDFVLSQLIIMDTMDTKSHMKTRFKCTQKYGLIHSDVSMESEKIIITNLVDVIK